MGQGFLHIRNLLKKDDPGDRKALREIYGLYYDRLIRYGCCIENDRGLVHDTIQDVFVWLLQHPEKLESIEDLDTYLFKCLRRNMSSNLQRERKQRNKAELFQENAQKDVSVELRLIESENLKNQSAWLTLQLDKLSSHQREVIYLRFYENLSYDEIAEIFSVSNQVVRNSVFRALKSLRKNGKRHPLKGVYFLFSFFL